MDQIGSATVGIGIDGRSPKIGIVGSGDTESISAYDTMLDGRSPLITERMRSEVVEEPEMSLLFSDLKM